MGRDSVLIRAAQQGHLEVARLLIEAGAEVNYRGVMGKSALYAAVENGRMSVAGLLLEKGANVAQASVAGMTPVMEAARGGNFRLIQTLLDKGADVNVIERPELGYARDGDGSSGMTALMFAARGGHQAAVALLLKAGAQATITNANGKRAVDEARDNGYENIVKLLTPGNPVTAQTEAPLELVGEKSEGDLIVRKYQGK
jgi:ankyrin repeat protein